MTLAELRELLPSTIDIGQRDIEWLQDPLTNLVAVVLKPPSASYRSWLLRLDPPAAESALAYRFWPVEWTLPFPDAWVVRARVAREVKEFRMALEAGAVPATQDLGELP